jgi:hypothetical protein
MPDRGWKIGGSCASFDGYEISIANFNVIAKT